MLPLLVLALSPIFGAFPVQNPTAQHQTSEVSNDVAVAMAVAPNGDVFVTGYSKIGATGYDYETVKYDADGKLQWTQRYDGTAGGDDRPSSIALDGQENVYVTGSSPGKGSGSDYLTLKYDSFGHMVWSRRLNGAGNGSDHPTSIAVSLDGSAWVTGYSQGAGSGMDCLTVMYDSEGNERWKESYNGPTNGDDYGNAISLDAAGNCYVAGYSKRTGQRSSYLALSYDRQGKQRWVANYGVDRKQDARAIALTLTAAGNLCVTGYAEGNHADSDIVTVCYSPAGAQIWTHRYDGAIHGSDKPTGIRAIKDNGSVVIGSSSGGDGTGLDYVTFCLNPDGKMVWQSRYNGSESGDDIPTAAVVGQDGSVFVTGYSQGTGSGSDFLTLAYDSSGKELWHQRFNGVGNDVDRPIGIGLDAHGAIYIAGYSWGGKGSNFDYAILKYSPAGELVWSRRLDSSATSAN